MDVRPLDPTADADALWALKRAFELELGGETGDGAKAELYEAKLTDAYRASYLDWVERCLAADPGCIQVAGEDRLVGYVFVLPQSMAHIWDAAVLNELFVRPDRRGTGVADGLMEAAFRVARAQSLPLDRMVLDVDPGNDRARAFYGRHGFEGWGEMLARPLR